MVLHRVVSHAAFEGIVLILIIYGSILLTMDNIYVEPDSKMANFLGINDMCLQIAFTIELVLKVVVYGLVLHPGAYLRSPWN